MTTEVISRRLRDSLALLDDPGGWERVNKLVRESKDALAPIRHETAGTLQAWVSLDKVPPLTSPESNGSGYRREEAKGHIEHALSALGG